MKYKLREKFAECICGHRGHDHETLYVEGNSVMSECGVCECPEFIRVTEKAEAEAK